MPDLWAIIVVIILIAFAIWRNIDFRKQGGNEPWDIKDKE